MKIVIFAGGVGTRLWPLSRKKTPKQFEKIVGDKSTLQLAVERLQPDFPYHDIFISTGKDYCEIIKNQLPQIPEDQIIKEPEMRDVGPAVGFLTCLLEKKFADTPMAILWSDHLVKNVELFRKSLKEAEGIVLKNPKKIVFIAQKPRFANQNLGWIEFENKGNSPFNLKSFKYRPDLETAQKYFEDGSYAWNLGYFVTTPGFLFSLFKEFAPNLYDSLLKIQKAYETSDFEKVLQEVYPTLEKISFDNAILEKMDPKNGLVISQDLGWSDIGAWDALKEALQKGIEDNVVMGKVITKDSKDCLIYNYSNQVLTVIDQKGQLIVNTNDVLLIVDKNSVPKVKKVVEELGTGEYSYLI